jgi:hypothetical protein
VRDREREERRREEREKRREERLVHCALTVAQVGGKADVYSI